MASPGGSSWASSFVSTFRKFDAYPKTLEDFRVQTTSGGMITLIASLSMILLFTSEIMDYLSPAINEELFVDTSRGLDHKLKINFDIVLHSISCDYLSLDAMDVSGEQHIAITHNVYKRRLDLQGQPINEPERQAAVGEAAKITNTTTKSEEDKNEAEPGSKEVDVVKCGSCYGAETDDYKCCNSCDEVKTAYARKSWKFDPRGVDQCRDNVDVESEKNALTEGCQLYGYLEVNRVGGSFHIGPGKSYSINHVHVHDVQPFTSTDFNTSHTIRHLSFGQQSIYKTESGEATSDETIDLKDSSRRPSGTSGFNMSPLDEVTGFTEKGATMFQYYLKIVPTNYVREDGSVFYTNQYSVTRHTKVVSLMSGESGMPGVFFSYELAPFMVKYSEKEKSLGHFLTGLCAIIGGVFTVAGIVDKLIYNSEKLLKVKTELGKAG